MKVHLWEFKLGTMTAALTDFELADLWDSLTDANSVVVKDATMGRVMAWRLVAASDNVKALLTADE